MPKSIIVYQQKISICKTDKLFLPIEGTSNMNIIYMRTRCYVYCILPIYLYSNIDLPTLFTSFSHAAIPTIPTFTHSLRNHAQGPMTGPGPKESPYLLFFFYHHFLHQNDVFDTAVPRYITKRCREGVQSKWAVIMRSKKDYPLYTQTRYTYYVGRLGRQHHIYLL